MAPNTSLLVLERLEQYLKYEIRPPAHLEVSFLCCRFSGLVVCVSP